jgi:hypothetical protein
MYLMLLIYVPDAVDPELCAVVDDCHRGGLLYRSVVLEPEDFRIRSSLRLSSIVRIKAVAVSLKYYFVSVVLNTIS